MTQTVPTNNLNPSNGDTYPALLMYQELADMACNRITAAITRQFLGERPIKALLNPYNPQGSTRYVRFNTSKTDRWDTNGPPPKNHVNWVVLDSDWEAEFCRAAESHSKVVAYTKNHNLGLEVPYRYGSETRKYLPDFIVLINDGPPKPDGTLTCSTSWWRSRATGARMPKRRSPRWRRTGCRA
jgi:type III restriction enzyme